MPNFHFFGLILSFLKTFAHQSTSGPSLLKYLKYSKYLKYFEIFCSPVNITLDQVPLVLFHMLAHLLSDIEVNYHYYYSLSLLFHMLSHLLSDMNSDQISFLLWCLEMRIKTNRQTDNSKEPNLLDQRQFKRTILTWSKCWTRTRGRPTSWHRSRGLTEHERQVSEEEEVTVKADTKVVRKRKNKVG